MLIGLDASRTTVARRTGTERYSLQLIRALAARESPHRLRLYFRDIPPPDLLPTNPRIEQRVIPFPRLWTHVRLSAELIARRPDVLFVPAHVLPLIHPAPSVVTIHDLGYLHFPDAHPLTQRLYLDWSTRFSARNATRVVADSEATRNDLLAYYRLPPEKIAVVYPGRDESLAPVREPARLAAARRKYSLPAEYLLHVGTIQPRKNLARLVEAFALVTHHPSPVTLVLAGRKGWLYESLFRRVDEIRLRECVRFIDYVADDDLSALYSGARAYVFPSLYEGFGFPALDAMACGTPVICSNASSLPEVVGDAAVLVDPLDTQALAEAIGRVLADETLRADLTQRGFEQAKRFSWAKAARETMAVLEEAVGERTNPKSKIPIPISQVTIPSTLHPPPSTSILGIPIHDVTYAETLGLIGEYVASGRPHQICTANPEFVMLAQRDAEFRGVLCRADLVLPDGIGLLWASRWLALIRTSHLAIRERVAGSTLTWKIAERAAERGWRVFFLGAGEGVAAKAAEILRDRYPGLDVVGAIAGSPRAEDEDEIAAQVRAASPHVLLVAYGAPKQDQWIARNAARLGVPVMVGVGGSLDFIAGVAQRAPEWLQALGLEWLHRLVNQPWRWRRMMALPKFALRVLRGN